MDIKEIEAIIKLMTENGVTHLERQTSDGSIKLTVNSVPKDIPEEPKSDKIVPTNEDILFNPYAGM